ncbi:MAG TPA: hypothetical protein VGC89_11290, partial [Pyrinomonadaceae bacterium]
MMKKIKWMISLIAALLVSSVCAQAQMKVHYINVGQAEAILLEMPKAAVLIDAGGECTCDDRDKDRLVKHLT